MTESMWTFLVVQLLGFLTLIAKSIYDSAKAKQDAKAAEILREQDARAAEATRIQDRLDREQDRLDREQLAKLTLDQLEAVASSGSERLKTLVKEIHQVKQVAISSIRASKEALTVANNHNKKIADAVTISQQVLEKLDSPQQVVVVNDESHRVPVTTPRDGE